MTLTAKKKPLIAIIGAGPSGSTLACLLALRGVKCILFDDNKRPSLLVGESLVPAAIPILRKIGVEAQVAALSQLKPGACFRHSNGFRVDIKFNKQGARAPDYAYNVPRPAFDNVLKQRAGELGVKIVSQRASLLADYPNDKVLIAPHSLEAGRLKSQPDLIIDATGRNRVVSKLMQVQTYRGARDDVAYFAHFRHFGNDTEIDGQIVISVLEQGWSWQIPLRDRLSVGVVLPKSAAQRIQGSPSEKLDQLIDSSQLLRHSGAKRERISPVMSYANYPIISTRLFGNNWALIGDAAGFTDPMLSPGVFMALKSSQCMDRHLSKKGLSSNAMRHYGREIRHWHSAWSELIDYFYDGKLLALSYYGDLISSQAPSVSVHSLSSWLTKRAVSAMVSGTETRSVLNQKMLKGACRSVLKEERFATDYKVN